MTAESISKEQATMLGFVLHEIRPEWSVASFTTLVGKNLTTVPSFGLLCEAAVRVANDPAKRTPAVIFMEGSHWRRDGVEVASLPAGPSCVDHPEQEAEFCRCCFADIKVGDRPATHQGKHWDPEVKS